MNFKIHFIYKIPFSIYSDNNLEYLDIKIVIKT